MEVIGEKELLSAADVSEWKGTVQKKTAANLAAASSV